jgi:long-subunit fatty acid transport protein
MLGKVTILLVIAFSFTLLNADIFFTFQPEVADAKAAALGRATVLTCTSSNALFTNPAGLSFVDAKAFQLGMRWNWGSRKSDYSYYDGENTSQETTYELNPKFNHFSFAIPLSMMHKRLKGTLALGYRAYYDRRYTQKWQDYVDDSSGYADIGSLDYHDSYHGGFNTLSIGFGVKLIDNLRAGLSANIGILSSGYHKWEYRPADYFWDPDGTLDNSFIGNFYNCGLIYKISDKLTFGLTYRPGFELIYKYETYLDDNDSWIVERRTTYQIPDQFALSAKFSLKENTHLFLEYQTCHLNHYQRENNTLWVNSEEGISLHAGLEIGRIIPIRFGYFYSSLPYYNRHYSLVGGYSFDVSPNPLTGFTAGLNLPFSDKINVDLTGEYAFISLEEEYSSYTKDTFRNRYRISATLSVLSLW